MTAQDLIVDVLLACAAGSFVVCTLGLLAGRTAVDRLHYAGAATSLPPWLVAAAVVVKERGSTGGIDAIVVAALLLVLGAALGHATARVARNREGRQ